MSHYSPIKLFILCQAYVRNQYTKNKEKPSSEKILKQASELRDEYLKKAEEQFHANFYIYQKEAFDPKKMFRLKKQNSYGFYKEYLENPIIQKYIKDFEKIWKNDENIKELDEETVKFTNGKAKNFEQYYDAALQENAKRIINKIAINLILNDMQIKNPT